MRRVGLGFAVGMTVIAAACTGEDSPFMPPDARQDGGSSADVAVDPGGPFVTTFGNNGTVLLAGPASAMAVAPGGEVVWVYPTAPETDSQIGVHRLDVNGKPDGTEKEADLVFKAMTPDRLEVPTAAGFGHRGPNDYVFMLGGRGHIDEPSSNTAWMRAYAAKDTSPTSPYGPLAVAGDLENVVAVAYGPNADGTNGRIYAVATSGSATDPSASILSNGGQILIADHAIAGGIAVHPDNAELVYGVARLLAPNEKQVSVVRANGVSVVADSTWNGGNPLTLDVPAEVASVNVVALDGGAIALAGTTKDNQLIVGMVGADAVVPSRPTPLGTLRTSPIVTALARRNGKLVLAGCIGAPATSHGWVAQVTLSDAGLAAYDATFGSKGQYELAGHDGECVKSMGLDQTGQITVLVSGPAGDRIHKLTL
jgi:hypothetical protein